MFLLIFRNIELLTSDCLTHRVLHSFSEESGNKIAENINSFKIGTFIYKYTHSVIFASNTMIR